MSEKESPALRLLKRPKVKESPERVMQNSVGNRKIVLRPNISRDRKGFPFEVVVFRIKLDKKMNILRKTSCVSWADGLELYSRRVREEVARTNLPKKKTPKRAEPKPKKPANILKFRRK
jgi:hypothetical protein